MVSIPTWSLDGASHWQIKAGCIYGDGVRLSPRLPLRLLILPRSLINYVIRFMNFLSPSHCQHTWKTPEHFFFISNLNINFITIENLVYSIYSCMATMDRNNLYLLFEQKINRWTGTSYQHSFKSTQASSLWYLYAFFVHKGSGANTLIM